MQNRINITFIIPSLRPGGAERIMSFIASNLDKEKFKSTLLVIGSPNVIAYNVENIDVIFLNKDRTRNALFKLFKYLLINNNDIVLSSIGQLNIIMSFFALFFWKTKFITRETFVKGTNMPRKKYPILNFIGSLQKKTIDKVICQSKDIYINLIDNFNYKEYQLVILNNPITNNFKPKKIVKQKRDIINFITIGRLTKQKGYERILSVLAKISTPFHYTIIGSGVEKENIFNLASELKLDDKITHIPFTKKIDKYLLANDIYLQGSHYEGFPNALLESCTVGTPVIAYNAPGGINEIVENGVNGFIVNSEEEFREKILLLRNKRLDPKTISESVTKKYSKEVILAKYEELFINILK